MEVDDGLRSSFSAFHLVVGSSVAIKAAASIVVPDAVGFLELLLWACCICACKACWQPDQPEESAMEEDSDWPCQPDAVRQKKRGMRLE